jgi:hypothetical protein
VIRTGTGPTGGTAGSRIAPGRLAVDDAPTLEGDDLVDETFETRFVADDEDRLRPGRADELVEHVG